MLFMNTAKNIAAIIIMFCKWVKIANNKKKIKNLRFLKFKIANEKNIKLNFNLSAEKYKT